MRFSIARTRSSNSDLMLFMLKPRDLCGGPLCAFVDPSKKRSVKAVSHVRCKHEHEIGDRIMLVNA